MSARIKFFRENNQAWEAHQVLGNHSIKSYIRERANVVVNGQEVALGYDLYVLKDDDVENARNIIDYELGSGWGENAT